MTTDFNRMWRKAHAAFEVDETESVGTLGKILESAAGRTFVSDLKSSDAALCIEILDHGLAGHKLHASEKQAFFCTLIELSGKHARLPESIVITDEKGLSTRGQPQVSGGFADVKTGKYKGRTVAVKTVRVATTDNFSKIRQQFCKEVILWNSLSHPNVLKLVGVLGDMECEFATVSEWMMHGHIEEYIRKNATNRLELLHGVGQGLKYIHDANLIHGDIKATNILITNDTPPVACLADFGFTTMVPDPQNPMSSIPELEGGSMTFMAPELLAPSRYGLKSAVPTQESDIYAFGLVIFQVLTGEKPFRNIKQEIAYYIPCGFRPDKPRNAEAIGISDSLWKLIERCWDGEKTRRPRIQEVVEELGEVAANWHIDMPPGGADLVASDAEEDESEELVHAGIFGSFKSEEMLSTYSSATDTSQSGDIPTASTRPTEAETYEEPEFKHSSQKDPSPPPRKRKGFRYFLKKVPTISRRKLNH